VSPTKRDLDVLREMAAAPPVEGRDYTEMPAPSPRPEGLEAALAHLDSEAEAIPERARAKGMTPETVDGARALGLAAGMTVAVDEIRATLAVPAPPPAPCDDHRPDGPDPIPACGCASVDRLMAAPPPAPTRDPGRAYCVAGHTFGCTVCGEALPDGMTVAPLSALRCAPAPTRDGTLTEEVDTLDRLLAQAWPAPWVPRSFEIDCPCPNGEHCGDSHSCEEVEATEAYPASPENPAPEGEGQCVVQISVPGLESLARPNAELIATARNVLPALIADWRRLRALQSEASGRERAAPSLASLLRWPDDWIPGVCESTAEGCGEGEASSPRAAMVEVRLTDAQWSALECAGLDLADGDDGLLRKVWERRRGILRFSASQREHVSRALTELANAEDDSAERDRDPATRKYARGARDALTNLASKVAGSDSAPPRAETGREERLEEKCRRCGRLVCTDAARVTVKPNCACGEPVPLRGPSPEAVAGPCPKCRSVGLHKPDCSRGRRAASPTTESTERNDR
jgi:hypothetical protein